MQRWFVFSSLFCAALLAAPPCHASGWGSAGDDPFADDVVFVDEVVTLELVDVSVDGIAKPNALHADESCARIRVGESGLRRELFNCVTDSGRTTKWESYRAL